MAIYGTALLSLCLLVGLLIGKLLGVLINKLPGVNIGDDANIGGVGIAMLLLILSTEQLQKSGRLLPPTQQGILFWSFIYIPIVVATAASQNVIAAVRGGPVALLAGAGAVLACFALVPVISRLDKSAAPNSALETAPAEDEP